MVPTSSLILMAFNALFGIAVPICLSLYLVRKHHAKLSTILIGAGTFLVFALVLESTLHQVVLKGPPCTVDSPRAFSRRRAVSFP